MKPKEGRPLLSYAIILVSVVMMIHSTVSPAAATIYEEYALRSSYITHGMRVISIVTYMFINADWVQLILNCFALWGIGTIMEGEVGTVRFGIVLLSAGVISGLTHVILSPTSTDVFVGSSGAVFGTLALLFLLAPFKKTNLFVVPLPAALVGILMASIEMASVAWATGSGVFTNDIQIAGFVTGAALSFWIDVKRAIKGLAIGAGVVIIVYMFGLFFNLI